ncbi:conserved hypothetical protein [Luminiphilus syltensis NOR5-1B]|uniref:DUF2269 family protein n=1 Tax=Luminiphilus syltensis NOR5-1B TaxID=565045 RepID=B8KT48_9GAMM|nr:hypothetical protein [Luminiphilus syltensis]EED36060.1 conserved hypothetical protein [Luminiphilus syltensis NOR5-1B]
MQRKVMKFLHTMGAIGMLGAMASLIVVNALLPDPEQGLETYRALRDVMDGIARWVLFPSLGVTLVSGLLSMAITTAFHNAGWAWLKLVSGVVMFEGTLLAVQGPIEREAELAAQAVSGELAVSALATTVAAEQASLWVLGFVASANVVLGVFRPIWRKRKVAVS